MSAARGFAALVAATPLLAWWLGIRLNLTASMPVGLYRAVSTPIQRNTLVLFCLPESIATYAHTRGYAPNGYCHGGVSPLGKRIVAIGGDTVVMTSAGLEVNGVLIANSKALVRDGRNRMLPVLSVRSSVVPPRYIWVISQYSERSFDSRYFGAIPDSCVRSGLRPLFTTP